MSITYVSAELRRLVVARAEGVCEYCLIAEEDTFYGCQIDHIISEKHGGPTQIEGVTAIGTVTARILGFNSGERLLERQILQEMNHYPSAAAFNPR